METEQIEALLREAMPESRVMVQGGDGKYQVTAVDASFEGLNAVRRQQAVYAILNPHIASGAIHAVSMQLLTPGEADNA